MSLNGLTAFAVCVFLASFSSAPSFFSSPFPTLCILIERAAYQGQPVTGSDTRLSTTMGQDAAVPQPIIGILLAAGPGPGPGSPF